MPFSWFHLKASETEAWLAVVSKTMNEIGHCGTMCILFPLGSCNCFGATVAFVYPALLRRKKKAYKTVTLKGKEDDKSTLRSCRMK